MGTLNYKCDCKQINASFHGRNEIILPIGVVFFSTAKYTIGRDFNPTVFGFFLLSQKLNVKFLILADCKTRFQDFRMIVRWTPSTIVCF